MLPSAEENQAVFSGSGKVQAGREKSSSAVKRTSRLSSMQSAGAIDEEMLPTQQDHSRSSPAAAGLENVQQMLNEASEYAMNNIVLPRASNIAAAASVRPDYEVCWTGNGNLRNCRLISDACWVLQYDMLICGRLAAHLQHVESITHYAMLIGLTWPCLSADLSVYRCSMSTH